jgi:RNase P subunit RPR2
MHNGDPGKFKLATFQLPKNTELYAFLEKLDEWISDESNMAKITKMVNEQVNQTPKAHCKESVEVCENCKTLVIAYEREISVSSSDTNTIVKVCGECDSLIK